MVDKSGRMWNGGELEKWRRLPDGQCFIIINNIILLGIFSLLFFFFMFFVVLDSFFIHVFPILYWTNIRGYHTQCRFWWSFRPWFYLICSRLEKCLSEVLNNLYWCNLIIIPFKVQSSSFNGWYIRLPTCRMRIAGGTSKMLSSQSIVPTCYELHLNFAHFHMINELVKHSINELCYDLYDQWAY